MLRLSFNDVKQIAKQMFSEWSEDKASRLAAALSYYAVFSLPPLLILTLAIAGQFYDARMAQQQMLAQVQGLVGDTGAEAVGEILANASRPEATSVAAVVSIVTLLWGASGVFTQLTDAMNTIWEAERKTGRGILRTIRERFFSFTMVLVLGFLLLVSLILGAALTAFSTWIGGFLSEAALVGQIVNLVVSFIVTTVLFAFIYKFIPDVDIQWRDVWVGAVVTAVLFTVGRWTIGLYIGRSAPASSYGTAGSLIVILLWIYYSAQILFLGAEFTQVWAARFGSRQTAPGQARLSDNEKLRVGLPIDGFGGIREREVRS